MHLVAGGVDNPGGHLDSPGSMVETLDVLLCHGSPVSANELDVDHVGRFLLGLWRRAVRCGGARLARKCGEGPDQGAPGGVYLGPLANNLQEMHMRMSELKILVQALKQESLVNLPENNLQYQISYHKIFILTRRATLDELGESMWSRWCVVPRALAWQCCQRGHVHVQRDLR